MNTTTTFLQAGRSMSVQETGLQASTNYSVMGWVTVSQELIELRMAFQNRIWLLGQVQLLI